MQYQLIYNVSLLQQMLVLEQFLQSVQYPYPLGIYSKYRFHPVMLPNKYYYLTDNKEERYISYQDFYNKFEAFSNLSRERNISILDDEIKYIGRVSDLSLQPYLPIRANTLLKDIFYYLIIITRKWDNKVIHPVDDAIEYGIRSTMGDIHIEKMNYLITNVSVLMDGAIEELGVFVRNRGWSELYLELDDDVVRIFDLGDYRIRAYMESNNRDDY